MEHDLNGKRLQIDGLKAELAAKTEQEQEDDPIVMEIWATGARSAGRGLASWAGARR